MTVSTAPRSRSRTVIFPTSARIRSATSPYRSLSCIASNCDSRSANNASHRIAPNLPVFRLPGASDGHSAWGKPTECALRTCKVRLEPVYSDQAKANSSKLICWEGKRMDAMIRASKGALALLALAGLGLLLRWMTAGSISGLKSYDLDSLTVLAVGTVAWIAYGWLVLAVVLTVLEQLPGAVGALAGAVAGRVTTKTARALLRSGLGVAAVTPLTVGVAHATPGDTTQVRPWTQPQPSPSVHLTNIWHPTEPWSTEQPSLPPTVGSSPQTPASPGPQSTANLGQQSTGGFARRSTNGFDAGSTSAFGTQVPPAARQLAAD